jgi:DNA polymerase-3 subunit epsilon
MFNWFKKEKTEKMFENPIEITITGINPQTENEFLFYDFVERQFAPHLEKWFEKAIQNGLTFKPQYEYAIQQKIKTNKFKNPHSFPEYFENKFDFIAIDFETANKNRVSACAIGLVFIKDFKIVYSTKHFIKPPKEEKFSLFHSNIHKIFEQDVEDSYDFKELWEDEFVKYFNDNLIVFHNASMDLSVLKNLFEYYSIINFNIDYIDTMQLAEKSGNPKKLTELAEKFGIVIENHHDPKEDAKVCALIYNELIDIYPQHRELVRTLNNSNDNSSTDNYFGKQATEDVKTENLDFVNKYTITLSELEKVEIKESNFVVTGKYQFGRENVEKFIVINGGILKPTITTKVNYVIIGQDYGWAKIQKIHELNTNKNTVIKILTELELRLIIKKYGT